MAFFSNSPRCGTNLMTVGDAFDKLKAFNAVHALKEAADNPTLLGDEDSTLNWRKLIHEGVINCGGDPMELDFFEQMFGGPTKDVDAKNLHFKYQCDVDMNIFAQDAATGAGPGQPATFQLLKGLHSGSGQYSYPMEGYSLYIYEDAQWVKITGVDKTNAYAHKITVTPYKKNYTVNIRAKKKIMVQSVQLVSGISCPKPGSSWTAPGYFKKIKPLRIRKDWELPIELLRGYEDVLQFAILIDPISGKEFDCWEAYEKTNARRDMKWAKNLIFYMGQEIDNPALLGSSNGQVTVDYGGFDGYIPTMLNGGGTVIDVDPSVGFDWDSNFEPLIIRNDAFKRTNEYVVLHAKPWWLAMNRNSDQKFKSNSGSCTFETFKRSGMDESAIKRLGVRSYEYANFSLHFKEFSALSDTRGIGNYNFPHMAHFIPGNGLRDSKGNSVPAMEFFTPKGCGASGTFEEHDRDMRKVDGCDILAGFMAESLMAAIHCPSQHILINPILTC